MDKPHLQRFKNNLDVILATKVGNSDYASSNKYGIVKVDGTTITASNGVISGTSQYTLPIATDMVLGGVKVDNETIKINSSGIISTSIIDYSTTEQQTRVLWIDEDTIYQNTISTTVSCTGGQWNEVCNVPTGLKKLIKGFAENDSFTCNPDIKVESGKIYVYPMNNFTLKTLTIFYTKGASFEYMSDLTWAEAEDYTWSDFSETQWEESE